ncbi:MAG: energy transducer TonB [Balneolaceae bacterium]
MFSLICSLLLFIIIIHLGPQSDRPEREYENAYQSEEIFVEDVIVTRQSTAPASPPKPQPPVPVPNDVIIEEEIEFPDEDDIFSTNPIQIENDVGKIGDEAGVVGSPERPAGILRIVEPTIPEAAKRQNLKAEIIVSFLVGTQGEVEEVFISEIRLYNGDSYEVVNDIGYGLLEATMEAAAKWRFRPARDDGKQVKTYVRNNFRIGF